MALAARDTKSCGGSKRDLAVCVRGQAVPTGVPFKRRKPKPNNRADR